MAAVLKWPVVQCGWMRNFVNDKPNLCNTKVTIKFSIKRTLFIVYRCTFSALFSAQKPFFSCFLMQYLAISGDTRSVLPQTHTIWWKQCLQFLQRMNNMTFLHAYNKTLHKTDDHLHILPKHFCPWVTYFCLTNLAYISHPNESHHQALLTTRTTTSSAPSLETKGILSVHRVVRIT